MDPDTLAKQRIVPLIGSLPTLAVLAAVLLFALYRVKCLPARFVIFAVWARLVMDAFPAYTVKPIVADLSVNALGSLLIVCLGVAMVRLRDLRLVWLLPIYALILVFALSAVIHGMPAAMINSVLKFAYLTLVLIGTIQALRAEGDSRFSTTLMLAFLPPILFQITSILFGVSKAGESDGSVSYIGGYFHESIYSVAVAGGLVAVAFAHRLRPSLRIAFLFASLASLLAANYRTTLIAMFPFLIYLLAVKPLDIVRAPQRALVAAAGMAAVLLLVVSVNVNLGTRVQSVVDFASKPTEFLRPTESFTRLERSEGSGRAYAFSKYVNAFRTSAPLEKLIGHGPDSWEDLLGGYAQNTILSYLFEIGVLGAVTVVLIWLTMMLPLFGVPREQLTPLALLHLGFAILNMSTMPFWQIEGIIMYGLICGYTIHYSRLGRRATAPALRHLPDNADLTGRPRPPAPGMAR